MVWRKLLLFTLLMGVLPIGSFFAVRSFVGEGASFSGGAFWC